MREVELLPSGELVQPLELQLPYANTDYLLMSEIRGKRLLKNFRTPAANIETTTQEVSAEEPPAGGKNEEKKEAKDYLQLKHYLPQAGEVVQNCVLPRTVVYRTLEATNLAMKEKARVEVVVRWKAGEECQTLCTYDFDTYAVEAEGQVRMPCACEGGVKAEIVSVFVATNHVKK